MYEFIFKKIKSCKLKKINSFILNKKCDKKIELNWIPITILIPNKRIQFQTRVNVFCNQIFCQTNEAERNNFGRGGGRELMVQMDGG